MKGAHATAAIFFRVRPERAYKAIKTRIEKKLKENTRKCEGNLNHL